MAVLAKVLPQCSALTELYLQRNEIADAGAQALADALPRSGLEGLYLDSNQIGDAWRVHWPMRCRRVDWSGCILNPTESVNLSIPSWRRCMTMDPSRS